MNGRLVIGFRVEEGAVGRIIGLVERRGFELRGVAMTGEKADGSLTLDVSGRDAGRSLAVLDGQIRRLAGVSKVAIFPQATDARP